MGRVSDEGAAPHSRAATPLTPLLHPSQGVVVLKLLDQTAAGKDDRQLVFLPPGSPTAFDGVPRPDGAPKVFPVTIEY